MRTVLAAFGYFGLAAWFCRSSQKSESGQNCPHSQRRALLAPSLSPKPFRVLYGIDEEHHEVQIQAIGVKEGNRLLIAGKEVEL